MTSAARAAVVLTGGTGARLGGVDKAALTVRGRTLLEHALAAVADADEVVVVGDPRPTARAVAWTREAPPGGGPAAALLAGVEALTTGAGLVRVLACDMPGMTAATFGRLAAAVTERGDGAVLVDEHGRRQTLAAVYRVAALRAAGPPDRAAASGLPLRRLLAGLDLGEVPAEGTEAQDVDTWADLLRLRS